jgi:adenylate kinase family enzyme
MISREELQNKKRILVLGRSGSGKSTFAKLLGKKLDIKVFHLDQYFHDPGWIPKEHSEFVKSVEEIISGNSWIIDGNYSSTLPQRVLKADAVYLYDYSRYFCIYRVFKRSLKSKTELEIRTDLPHGCRENLFPDYEFLKFIWDYKTTKIYSILELTNFDKKNLMIFKDRKEFKNYMIHLNY